MIDFSNMPEGSTHYYKSEFSIDWLKTDGIQWYGYGSTGWLAHWLCDDERCSMINKIPPMRTVYVKDDRHINEIAKAMIDGEVFYSKDGKLSYRWDGKSFLCNLSDTIGVAGDFYRKILQPIDERQGFIELACKITEATADSEAANDFAKLYDAGFRKPE